MSDARSNDAPPPLNPPMGQANRSQQLLERMIESVKDYAIFALDEQRRVTVWNKGAERIFGYSESEMLGQSGDILFVPEDRESDVPEKEARTAIATGRSEDERWHLRKDGSRFYAGGVSTPIRDDAGRVIGFTKVCRDMTAAMQQSEALEEREERYRALAQASAQIVWTTDAAGNVIEYSPSWCDFTGQTAEEWLGSRWSEAVHPDDRERTLTEWRKALETKMMYTAEYRLRHVSGKWRWMAVRGVPLLNRHGEVRGWVGMHTDIHAQKEAEEALRESEEHFREMADAAPAMLWLTDPEGACIFLSRNWQEFTGQRESEGLGLGWSEIIHPDEKEITRRAFITANRDRDLFAAQFRVHTAKGEYRWVTDIGRPRFDRNGDFLGFIGAVFDVHEQHQLQRKLQFLDDLAEATRGMTNPERIMRAAVQRLGEHLRVSRCAYADVEADSERFTIQQDYTDGCLSTVGSYHLSLFGPRATADMREGRILVVHDVDAEFLPSEGADMFNAIGVKAIICCPLVKRDGLRAMMAVHNTTPREWTTEEVALVEAVVERCWAYIERARAEASLREREQMLRDQDRRKNEFLAMLAHELRNPLAAIKNALAVQDVAATPQDRDWAKEVVNRQTDQLARLVDDLLDVSRITSGKIRLHKESLDAAPILDHAVGAVRPLLVERKHKLHTDYDRSGTALPLEADASRLEQIVLNLLTNAAKYTESGGTIWLSARSENNEVIISVRDTGIGIPPDMLPKMFELFTQGERSLSRSEGGLGLGLTIVRQLCEMHGGTITAHSEGTGKGSEFIVRLPAGSHKDVAPALEIIPDATVERTRSTHRVLVVDDNADSANGLARLLKLNGHTVEVAYEGPGALTAARLLKPTVVLLDIGLPGMDGYEVAMRIRSDEIARDALLIAISGYGQEEDRRRSNAAGFDAHLLKPIDFGELKRLIDSQHGSESINRHLGT